MIVAERKMGRETEKWDGRRKGKGGGSHDSLGTTKNKCGQSLSLLASHTHTH